MDSTAKDLQRRRVDLTAVTLVGKVGRPQAGLIENARPSGARRRPAGLLDSIATNVLSLRLGDDPLAREIYADVRDQAIRGPHNQAAPPPSIVTALPVIIPASGPAR